MSTDREGTVAISRRSGRSSAAWLLSVAAAALCCAAPALAVPIATLGGIDDEGQYTCPSGAGPTCFGTLSFDGTSPGSDPGEVTSSDLLPSVLLGALVSFEVVLGPLKNSCADDPGSCANPNFTPGSTRIDKARFLGSGHDLVISDGTNVLLAFDVHFIDVSGFVKAINDPAGDGAITLGAFSEESFGVLSELALSGGTLNQLVGGIGAPAILSVQLISLTPSLANPRTYLGADFLTGVGAAPVSASTWDLTILPASVPEPSTAALVGAGLLGLIASARRRSRRGPPGRSGSR